MDPVMSWASNFAIVLPEEVLSTGAILLMLVAAWGGAASTRAVSIASVFVLVGAGIANVIVTLGARGALWAHAGGRELVDAPAVDAVDTTGAGDAFIGCFSTTWVGSGDVLAATTTAPA